MMQNNETLIKLSTVWGAVYITSWTDVAAALASLYTLILIGEWSYKKLIRPILEKKGWMNRKMRRASDTAD